jgi:catalase
MRGQQGGALGLLQDTQLIETLAHFSRERIPERYGPIEAHIEFN